MLIQVFKNGEEFGYPIPLTRVDDINANQEGFSLGFDPETRWYGWGQGYTFAVRPPRPSRPETPALEEEKP